MKSATPTHDHPRPLLNRFTQYGALAAAIICLLAACGQALLVVFGLPGTFLLTGLMTLFFAPFLLLLTVISPAVTLSPDGLEIRPLIWKAHFIPWAQVTAIKDYPLLPMPEAETGRKALTGRLNYRPAAGKMLLIPSLPAHYRIAGLLCGEGFTGIIALTNRAHTDYEGLIHQIEAYRKREIS